jgi:hypothetical protein
MAATWQWETLCEVGREGRESLYSQGGGRNKPGSKQGVGGNEITFHVIFAGVPQWGSG